MPFDGRALELVNRGGVQRSGEGGRTQRDRTGSTYRSRTKSSLRTYPVNVTSGSTLCSRGTPAECSYATLTVRAGYWTHSPTSMLPGPRGFRSPVNVRDQEREPTFGLSSRRQCPPRLLEGLVHICCARP